VGSPLLFTEEFELIIMIGVAIEEMHPLERFERKSEAEGHLAFPLLLNLVRGCCLHGCCRCSSQMSRLQRVCNRG